MLATGYQERENLDGIRAAWRAETPVSEEVRRQVGAELDQAGLIGAAVWRRVDSALQSVNGVASVRKHSRETRLVIGAASGHPLAIAAAQVVDDLHDRIRLVTDSAGSLP